jgi:hypothetical protein
MSNLLPRIALRAAYGATQLPRVAWHIGHGLAMRRLARAAQRKNGNLPVRAPIPMRKFQIADASIRIWQFFSGKIPPT